jgi:hypothetical protein
MLDRWQQVYRAGEVTLHPFTPAELNAVTLDSEALSAAERGPFVQAVTPLLTGPGAAADGTAQGLDPAVARTGPEMEESAAAVRAAAAASLERHRFLRPGPPAPATGRAPDELAGWAASPDGYLAARRQVTLIGDLAIITRIRAQPDWVTEVTVSPDPAEPDWPARWPLLARMYSPYRPPVGLIEMPATAGRRVPPYVLVGPERAVQVLAGWCGADLAACAKQQRARAGVAEPAPFGGPMVPVPTAERAGEFTKLVQLRVALADRERVVRRNLVVATGERGHWLLEGEWWQRAVPVSVDELGQRVAAMLKREETVKG